MNPATPLRKTKARQAVSQILQAYATPMTLRELFTYGRISIPSLAYSTVFRIIRSLETEGRVVRVDWRERGSRYEWADLPHHHHIVCQVCGKLQDLADRELDFNEDKIKKSTGYLVKYHSIELEGICPQCQRGSKA